MKHAPRQLVHRGVVEAAAVLVEEARLGAREARRRVVAAWSSGAAVHRLGDALLLRFPATRPLDCARAPGIPLVLCREVLTSAPLAPDELPAPPRGSVVLVRGGEVVVEVPAEPEDPALWLDLDAFAVVAVSPLGEPPPALVVAAPVLVDARDLLGVDAPPGERAAVLRALAEGGTARIRALSFLGAVTAALGAWLTRRRAQETVATGPRDALATVPAEDPGPSLLDRAAARLQTWLARLLVATDLARHLGRRQAAYVERLLDMLDRGDLHEALRHAIPLGGEGSDARPVAPALGVPTPRADLALSFGRAGIPRAMFGSLDLMALLRARYRAAFERLDREERVEEAAFVLAELLQESAEAVSFLERHDRLLLAAQLAEARKLAPAVQVRQWFLAGEIAHAMRLARRHGVFAEAVALLGDHPRGPELRVRWAESLAAAGDFSAAVRAAWPVEAARSLAFAWIEAGIAQGGSAGARLLARKAGLRPEAFAEVWAQARPLLEATGPHAAAERRALGEGLLDFTSAAAAVGTLARPLIRALVRDAQDADPPRRRTALRLADTFDEALRADLPTLPRRERPRVCAFIEARLHHVDAADTGTMPLHDAALLPAGRVALALGEAGVRVIGRRGEALFHLDQPAHALVVSDHGDRALALAARGSAARIARLDLVGRRGEPWCEARIGAFARDFDGAQWVVAEQGRLLVIDTLEARFSALASFELEELEVPQAVGRSATSCALLTGIDLLSFALPAWTLRTRRELLAEDLGPLYASGIDGESAAFLGCAGKANVFRLLHVRAGTPAQHIADWPRPGLAAKPLRVAVSPACIAAAAQVEGGVEVSLLDVPLLRRRLVVMLAGAKSASLRLDDETLTVADDRGRVLVVDLAHGDLLHDLRI